MPLAPARDDQAFELHARRYGPRLLRHAYGILGNQHDAKDATQTALMKAFRALRDGAAPEVLLAWMLGICTNECRSMMRRTARDVELTDRFAAAQETAHDRAERRERIGALIDDLGELSQAQRTAFVLNRIADRPSTEVARSMGGTPAAVRALVHEADASLAEYRLGRELACEAVRERLLTGGGRSLRARRIRAYLRSCAGCRALAVRIVPGDPARRGSVLVPLPVMASWGRALLDGPAQAVVVAKGIGTAGLV